MWSKVSDMRANPALKFAPSGRWDAPSARPLAPRYASMRLATCFCTMLAVLFCTTADANPVKPLPATQAECQAKGGVWRSIGLPGSPPSCDLKTTDAGKVCSDSGDCQGICVAPSNAVLNSKGVGTCSAHVVEFSCFKYVAQGVVDTICVD
jgi:hypothetical protein